MEELENYKFIANNIPWPKAREREMMTEPQLITEARKHLMRFESQMMSDDSINHLTHGFDLLEEVIEDERDYAELAKNIGDSYTSRAQQTMMTALNNGSSTEPELERACGLLRELKAYRVGSPDDRRSHRWACRLLRAR